MGGNEGGYGLVQEICRQSLSRVRRWSVVRGERPRGCVKGLADGGLRNDRRNDGVPGAFRRLIANMGRGVRV